MASPSDEKGEFPNAAEGYIIYKPEIGSGAFAQVHKGKVKATGQDVAIKRLKLEKVGESLDDIRKEIAFMSTMRSPSLVRIYASFVYREELWIVMPLLIGSCHAMMKELQKDTHQKGIKDEALLATILREVLKGLEYVHNDNLIHRDIKAGNILVSVDGGIQLADFGVAGALTEGGSTETRRTFTGTPCWMAPEVMEQTKGYDAKADIWSVGITALELAMGSAPYAHHQPMKVLLLTLQEPPPTFDAYPDKNTQWSTEFKNFIKECLKKAPKDRPTAKKLLSSSKFLKKALDPAIIKAKLVEPSLARRGDETWEEIDLDTEAEETLNEDTNSHDSGFWTFAGEDLGKAARGEITELVPIETTKRSRSKQEMKEAQPAAAEAASGDTANAHAPPVSGGAATEPEEGIADGEHGRFEVESIELTSE